MSKNTKVGSSKDKTKTTVNVSRVGTKITETSLIRKSENVYSSGKPVLSTDSDEEREIKEEEQESEDPMKGMCFNEFCDGESSHSKGRRFNHDRDIYTTIIDECGNEVEVKVEETPDERRRRMTRERARRFRMKLSDFERKSIIRQQQIRRLRKQLEETEEEAQIRKNMCREYTRRSRQRKRNELETTDEETETSQLKSSKQAQENKEKGGEICVPTQSGKQQTVEIYNAAKSEDRCVYNISRGKITFETSDELDKRLGCKKQKLNETKLGTSKQHSNEQSEDVVKSELPTSVDLDKDTKNEEEIYDDVNKNNRQKHAPGDVDYLFFYESSAERRRRLNREKQIKRRKRLAATEPPSLEEIQNEEKTKAKLEQLKFKLEKRVAERRLKELLKFDDEQLEMLMSMDLDEDEPDMSTSRRCLDLD